MQYVTGIDPSSKKIAAVRLTTRTAKVEVIVFTKDVDIATRCAEAYAWADQYANRHAKDAIYLESPVYAVGGLKALLPLARASGAILAGFGSSTGEIVLTNVPAWKKAVVGKGNANKDQIKKWVEQNHPKFHSKWKDDQDVIDAFCIALYGLNQQNITPGKY